MVAYSDIYSIYFLDPNCPFVMTMFFVFGSIYNISKRLSFKKGSPFPHNTTYPE